MKTVVVPLPAVVWGGLQGVVSTIDEPLKALGYSQHVLVPFDAEDVRDRLRAFGVSVSAVNLPRVQRSLGKTAAAMAMLIPACKAIASDPIVAQASIFQAVGVHHPHSPLLARHFGKPLVWQLHSDAVSGVFRTLARRYITANHDGIVANGERIGKTFMGRSFDVINRNHRIFFPPIRVDRYSPNPAARRRARQQLGYDDNMIVIAAIGNRSWQKNHELFVEVAAKMVSDERPISFLIVGASVPNYARQYQEGVVAPAERLNAERPGFVRFAHYPEGLDDVVHAIDLLVLTSHSEGIPLVVAECMAAAKPVVSTDVGSISEVVANGQCGYVLPRADADLFVQQISQLVADPVRRGRFARTAIEFARQTFSPEAVASIHADVYARAECKRAKP